MAPKKDRYLIKNIMLNFALTCRGKNHPIIRKRIYQSHEFTLTKQFSTLEKTY